jgi:CBS domain-containing protein
MNIPISALLERKGTALYTVNPTMTITEAVAEMNRHQVGSVVVLEEGKLAGIFTERDVLKRVVGAGVNPVTACIKDVMTRNVLTITPGTTIEQAMKIFTEKRCRHLPVVVEGELRGLVSIGDVTRWMADSHQAEAEHLKNYISGGFPS